MEPGSFLDRIFQEFARGAGAPGAIAILAFIGLVLIKFELMAPGFVFGLVGTGCIVLSAYGTYATYGPVVGTAVLAGLVGAVAVLFALWIRTIQHTHTQDPAVKAGDPSLGDLAGKEGKALSPLRPSGFVEVAGRRVDAISRGEPIDAGAAVRVVAIEGGQAIVKAVAS